MSGPRQIPVSKTIFECSGIALSANASHAGCIAKQPLPRCRILCPQRKRLCTSENFKIGTSPGKESCLMGPVPPPGMGHYGHMKTVTAFAAIHPRRSQRDIVTWPLKKTILPENLKTTPGCLEIVRPVTIYYGFNCTFSYRKMSKFALGKKAQEL